MALGWAYAAFWGKQLFNVNNYVRAFMYWQGKMVVWEENKRPTRLGGYLSLQETMFAFGSAVEIAPLLCPAGTILPNYYYYKLLQDTETLSERGVNSF